MEMNAKEWINGDTIGPIRAILLETDEDQHRRPKVKRNSMLDKTKKQRSGPFHASRTVHRMYHNSCSLDIGYALDSLHCTLSNLVLTPNAAP